MRKIILSVAFAVSLMPDYGFTLGLGEIEVSTALNQELNAEIELLSAAPEDVETLIVKLASREEFSRAGIDRPYLLNSLKFKAEIRDGKPIIRVTSDKPIREPFLNFLVEIDWPKGHMMREYTILLDPPVFMGGQQAPAESEQIRPAAMEPSSMAPTTDPGPEGGGLSPGAAAVGAASGTVYSAPSSKPGTKAQVSPFQVTTSTEPTSSYRPPAGYRVQRGDTLWSLADSLRPDQSVTIEQMMLALLKSNPEAFINDNVNGLKRGYVLRIPDRDQIVALNKPEAIALVKEQHALWREYQQAVAGGEPTTAIDDEGEAGIDTVSDEAAEGRLEIVAAGSGVSASGSKDPTQMTESELRAELAIARESLETERVEKEELQQRVAALEGQVERMKALLTLEDTDMAELQRAATPVEAETAPPVDDIDEAIVEELVSDEAAEIGGEQAAIEEALTDEEAAAQEQALIDELTAAEDVAEEAAELPEVFLEEEQIEAADQAIERPMAADEEFAVAPPTQPAFMQPKEGPLAAFLNNPVLLAAAGGGLLLVLMLIALILRRRRTAEEEPAVASNLEEIGDQVFSEEPETEVVQAEGVAETAAPAVEASAEVQEQQGVSETPAEALAAEDTIETPAETAEATRDDVIAEADVYLAYGIYQQAEELLQNAIKKDPDNDSYRAKLAETYDAGKNAEGFIELATDVNQRRNGKETALWKKIVAIGVGLCPDHALFKAAAADKVGDLSMDDLASTQAETADIDLDLGEEQEALVPELDLDLDESEAAAETPADSVEFDLAETGADASLDIEEESVEFDLAETGADTINDEADQDMVEFGLDEAQAIDAAQSDEDEFSLDIDAAELGVDEDTEQPVETAGADSDFEIDLSEEEVALVPEEEAEEAGEEAFSLDDIDAADLGLDTAETDDDVVEETQNESAVAFDMDDVELDEAVARAVSDPEAIQDALLDSDDELDLSELDDIDEVGTKLDLAKAYLDMGDADGTRSILDEVMTEGDDTQKKEAEELLRQIG